MNKSSGSHGHHSSLKPPTSSSVPKITKVECGYPIIGTLLDIFRDAPGFLSQVAHKYPGEIVGVQLGPVTGYLVTSPEHVQQVFQEHMREFTKGGMWRALRMLVGQGLPASEGELWLRQRRLMQPLFSPTYLATLADTMIDVIDRERVSLAAHSKGAVIDMKTEMQVMTQRVLLETLFGAGIERQEANSLVEQLEIAFQEMNLRMFLFFLPNRLPLPGDRRFKRAVAIIDDAMFRLVRMRRASGEQRKDLLSLLLRARDDSGNVGMDDQQLRDELVALFVAGNETTANALTWAWYLLDQNPDVERKLRTEIETVLGGRRPTYADLEMLNYSKLVFLEALRLYPPAWLIPRFAPEERMVGGYRIPANSPVLLSPWITQRDPGLWPDPEKFEPERFSPERSAGRPRYAYYPFGGGPRKCVGESLAVMEGQLALVMMTQRFRPRLLPGTKVTPSSMASLKPRYPLKMTLGAA